jgi:hypothetical protein
MMDSSTGADSRIHTFTETCRRSCRTAMRSKLSARTGSIAEKFMVMPARLAGATVR